MVTEEYGIQNEEEQAMILKQIADAGPEVYSGVLTFSYTRQQAGMTQYVRLTAQKIPVVVLDDELTGIDGLYCISPSEKLIGELCAEFFSLAVPKEGTIIVSGGKKDSKGSRKYGEQLLRLSQRALPGSEGVADASL